MITQNYLQKEVQEKITKTFKKFPHIAILASIFQNAQYTKITQQLTKQKWKQQKIPNKYSYKIAALNKSFATQLLPPELTQLLYKITSTKKIKNLALRKFARENYTLIHDEEQKNSTEFKFVLMFVDAWSHDYGGNRVLVKNEESYIVPPTPNTLVIYQKSAADKEFMQYINHKAKQKTIIALEGTLAQ